jgi:rhodanese-related sulfurtransferase
MNYIDAATLQKRIQSGQVINLVDVREAIEFYTYNIGGINIPLSKLLLALPLSHLTKTDEIIMICKVGLRSKTAQSILLENGYLNTLNLAGGLLALQKLNKYPVLT